MAKAPDQTKTELFFAFEKSTENAYRFQECDKDGKLTERAFAKIGQLYVKKTTLGQEPPKRIAVTLTVVA